MITNVVISLFLLSWDSFIYKSLSQISETDLRERKTVKHRQRLSPEPPTHSLSSSSEPCKSAFPLLSVYTETSSAFSPPRLNSEDWVTFQKHPCPSIWTSLVPTMSVTSWISAFFKTPRRLDRNGMGVARWPGCRRWGRRVMDSLLFSQRLTAKPALLVSVCVCVCDN